MARPAFAIPLLLLGLAWSATAEAAGKSAAGPPPPSPGAAPAGHEGIPDSLARYYPPRDRKRTYTLEMLELGRLLGSLATDLRTLNGGPDRSGIKDELDRFARQYDKVAAMVPEWSAYFAAPSVAALKEGLDAGKTRGDLEPLLGSVAETCTNCHANEMFKVQAIYHWPSFSDVEGQDASGEAVPFHETMVRLADRLGALPTAVRRGDWNGARNHQREITVQFALLEDSCGACHQTPRSYFVDERVKAEVMKLGAMVRKQEPDAAAYAEIGDQISYRSCIPCHQVHMPAAYLQQRLRK